MPRLILLFFLVFIHIIYLHFRSYFSTPFVITHPITHEGPLIFSIHHMCRSIPKYCHDTIWPLHNRQYLTIGLVHHQVPNQQRQILLPPKLVFSFFLFILSLLLVLNLHQRYYQRYQRYFLSFFVYRTPVYQRYQRYFETYIHTRMRLHVEYLHV